MRRSAPIALRTWSTLAPTASATFAISFMKEIRVARMALAAYLLSSALAQSITMIGAPVRVNGAYSSRMSASRAIVLHADHDPVGLEKVFDRRALLQELRIAHDAERVARSAADDLAHAGGRPTGTVLLSTITL